MGPHAGPPHQPCPRHSARTARQTTRGVRYAGSRTNGTTRGARAAREGNVSTAYATGGTSSRRRQIRMSPYCECSPKKFAQILSYVRNLTPVRNTSTVGSYRSWRRRSLMGLSTEYPMTLGRCTCRLSLADRLRKFEYSSRVRILPSSSTAHPLLLPPIPCWCNLHCN